VTAATKRSIAAPSLRASIADSEAPPSTRVLALGALGVVYGDIGTNPLFALQEAFVGSEALAPTRQNVLGVLSLVFWALIFVVSVKYLTFVMRASNEGEGGILALLALVPAKANGRGRGTLLVFVVLFGAALLYGDGVVTPAISVLSAIEGLKTAAPSTEKIVVPLTIAILLGLFAAQRSGTHRIGSIFGPVMILWFVAIAACGISWIVRQPAVLLALDPRSAISFVRAGGWHAFSALGAVVLCIAGGEALYADMGHFGRRPIAIAWYALVLPCLVCAYFGQGAFLLGGGSIDGTTTFYAIVPSILVLPMVLLAAFATVIASQALISGAYSLTHQAMQLGFFPRVSVVHTSAGHIGQIYVPFINTMLAIACVALVGGFGASSKLAAAYGLAVTGTMTITSIAYFVVLTRTWKWPIARAVLLVAAFLAIDLAFLSANLSKFLAGGWVPVGIGVLVFSFMTIWMAGRRRLSLKMASLVFPAADFVRDLGITPCARVRGTAVFMTAHPTGIPPLLFHHFKHNQVLHEEVILLSIASTSSPFVTESERVTVEELGQGLFRVQARFGFMQTPDAPAAIATAAARFGLRAEPARTSYYLGRETLITARSHGPARWWRDAFAIISRNAQSAQGYFGIPPNRVIELGIQLEL
jgi:KUP system potassium uptake protein